MNSRQSRRVFVKLNYGSSASGIAALEQNPKTGNYQLFTTMEHVVENGVDRFYNNLKIRRTQTLREITCLLDFLFREGAHVEQWIPKATYQGFAYDLRAVAIGHHANHIIARLSKSPFTNLHLGNRRMRPDEIGLKPEQLDAIQQVAITGLQTFKQTTYAGFDIILPANSNRPLILEVNAFGDQINNLRFNQQTICEAQIRNIISHPHEHSPSPV